MPRGATLSILGLYRADPTIFDLMTLPSGLDKQKLITMLCAQLSAFSVIYPDPTVMKSMIDAWSFTQAYEWDGLYNSMILEYQPIENYDRIEDTTRQSSSEGESLTSAFNAADYQPDNKATGAGQETVQSHIHGNVGVTTSQQMLESEREVRKFNIYKIIIAEFADEFCVRIY